MICNAFSSGGYVRIGSNDVCSMTILKERLAEIAALPNGVGDSDIPKLDEVF